MSVSDDQRRVHQRTDGTGFHFLLDLDEQQRPVNASSTALLDLSASGCGLYQASQIAIGTKCGVVFWKQRRFQARLATVMHCEVQDNGWTRVGLKFESTSSAITSNFVTFVETQFNFADHLRRTG